MLVLVAAMATLLATEACGGAPAAKSPESVTRAKALDVAREALRREDPQADFVVDEARTLQKDFGWVFFYAPRAYLKSGDPGDLVPGSGPLVVERRGGKTTFLSSSVPPEKAIEEFEKEWRKRVGRKRDH